MRTVVYLAVQSTVQGLYYAQYSVKAQNGRGIREYGEHVYIVRSIHSKRQKKRRTIVSDCRSWKTNATGRLDAVLILGQVRIHKYRQYSGPSATVSQ